ncbi:MAG: Outer membrane protein assembly factor BamA [Alphaproteobacteria bacterium MarineAlpha5_Bin9]|nr:MAG: Outer membrane protein assembly factor BamA [Alphaproteobacteria bacterium MarineAlpha5_Bin9]
MIMRFNFKYLKYFLCTFIFSINLYAQSNKEIIIEGNKNVDDEIIFSIINDKITDYSKENLNDIIKVLYSTGNFNSIEIEYKDDNIIFKIIENPSINSIKFIGNERFKKSEIFEIFNEDDFFSNYNEYYINNFIIELKNLYASFGYNIVNISYIANKVDDPSSNLVDLIFTINEGDISKINRIYFIGNDTFSNSKLKSVIKSQQRTLLNFFSNTNYKKYQVINDKKLLINYYKENGFKDVNIDIENEFLTEKNRLNIYFYINEGTQYILSDLNYDTTNLKDDNEALDKFLDNEKNKILKKSNIVYNPELINESKNRIIAYLNSIGTYFFKFDIYEKENNELIDIIIQITDEEPIYVNQINVYGNSRTQEKVIRREINFAEGDPYNAENIKLSNTNLKNLGFFKDIKIKENKVDDQIDIDIVVEEQTTGQFQVGLAVDSFQGPTFITGLQEKNIFGVGRELNLNINTSSNNTIYKFGIVEPYIFNRDIDFLYNLSYTDKDLSDSKSYELYQFSTDVGVEYALTNKINHSVILEYQLKDYTITNSSASNSIKRNGGTNAVIEVRNALNYYDLDSFLRPSKGSYIKFVNSFSPATNDDNGYITNTFNYSKYYTYRKKNILSFKTKIGNITSIQNKEIPVDNKFSLGGRWLRGFDSFGVGPRDSRSSYVGGRNIIAAKFDYQRPILGDSNNPIDLNLFTDFGKVFDNKIDPKSSTESIRASYGYGIKFYSPIGPIGFSWAFPIQDEEYDIKRMFLFTIGNLN